MKYTAKLIKYGNMVDRHLIVTMNTQEELDDQVKRALANGYILITTEIQGGKND